MTYEMAKALVDTQERKIRKIDGVRFEHKGFEYRLVYEGGFAAFIRIDRRQIGKRNFKYFKGFGAYNCWNAEEAFERIKEIIVA